MPVTQMLYNWEASNYVVQRLTSKPAHKTQSGTLSILLELQCPHTKFCCCTLQSHSEAALQVLEALWEVDLWPAGQHSPLGILIFKRPDRQASNSHFQCFIHCEQHVTQKLRCQCQGLLNQSDHKVRITYFLLRSCHSAWVMGRWSLTQCRCVWIASPRDMMQTWEPISCTLCGKRRWVCILSSPSLLLFSSLPFIS